MGFIINCVYYVIPILFQVLSRRIQNFCIFNLYSSLNFSHCSHHHIIQFCNYSQSNKIFYYIFYFLRLNHEKNIGNFCLYTTKYFHCTNNKNVNVGYIKCWRIIFSKSKHLQCTFDFRHNRHMQNHGTDDSCTVKLPTSQKNGIWSFPSYKSW